MNKVFIVEHLEPKLWPWCFIEYKQISKIVGRKNLWFTKIKDGKNKLKKYGKVHENSVKKLNIKRICVLDPAARKTLTPKDASKFDYFIFGGILGDFPARKRTKELTSSLKSSAKRNLGKDQLSTDNAVYVAKQIIQGRKLEKIRFQKDVEIKISKIQSTILPFKYPMLNGKPNISKELVSYIKKKDRI